MSEVFKKFKESSFYIVITIIFPVVAVVATVLIYLNAEALRDQSAQHLIDLSSSQSRVQEKNAQIVLLNEQIKQKSTQSEILKSQVDLLEKINSHHDEVSKIDILAIKSDLANKQDEIRELNGKLKAFDDIKEQYGKADKIAGTISSLRDNLEQFEIEIVSLKKESGFTSLTIHH